MSTERKKPDRLAPPIETITLLDIEEILGRILKHFEDTTPKGIVEPLSPITVTTDRTYVRPIYPDKKWFSVTIVKEDAVELSIVINTGESGTTPYTMGADEVVYDQYFSRPCISDVMLWAESGNCRVKIRGSR